MPGPWTWDPKTKRYRGADGKFLSQQKMVALRDEFVAYNHRQANRLARRLAEGEITIQEWEAAMRDRIKLVHCDLYMLGRGGRRQMLPRDWGRVGNAVRGQYGFLRGLAEEIVAGQLSEAKIAQRSRMYVSSATASYERGRAAAFGVPLLPQYPGDGRTACLSSCKCHWSISEDAEFWRCSWVLGSAEHCPDCAMNAARWAPLVIPKGSS